MESRSGVVGWKRGRVARAVWYSRGVSSGGGGGGGGGGCVAVGGLGVGGGVGVGVGGGGGEGGGGGGGGLVLGGGFVGVAGAAGSFAEAEELAVEEADALGRRSSGGG